MSSGTVRRVSRQDIQLVQNLIERCLQLYMNEKEVVETLLVQAKIEPGFTELVWQKLEEENREFFQAYYLRLRLKHQIIEFNKLLEQQVQLTRQMYPTGVTSVPATNGNHIPHLHQNPACYASDHNTTQLKPENIHPSVGSGLSNVLTNGGSSLHRMHSAMEISAHANQIDAPTNMISSRSSNMGGLMQGMNGGIIKTEVGFSGGSPYMYGTENNLLETQSAIGDASVTSFSTVESTSQPLHEQLLDADTSSFGFLGQIPRNISLSDLTAFSQSSDILESYSGSPFLGTDGDHFLDARERGEQGFSYGGVAGENRRLGLDSISEGLNYEDFGSE